jgi:hypothetical protein
MLRPVALVRTDVSEEFSASSVKVTRIGELGATLDVISNRRTLRRNTSDFLFSYIIRVTSSVASLYVDQLEATPKTRLLLVTKTSRTTGIMHLISDFEIKFQCPYGNILKKQDLAQLFHNLPLYLSGNCPNPGMLPASSEAG